MVVEPSMGIVLMPDAIHSGLTQGEQMIRYLLLCGRAVETPAGPIVFGPSAQTYATMDIGFAGRR